MYKIFFLLIFLKHACSLLERVNACSLFERVFDVRFYRLYIFSRSTQNIVVVILDILD